MAIPRPAKKLKLLPSVRCGEGLYIAVLEYLAINKAVTFGSLVREALALYIAGDRHHDFESQSTVIVGASKVFAESGFDEQSRVAPCATEED